MVKPITMGISSSKRDPSKLWACNKIRLNDWDWFYKEIKFWIYYEIHTGNTEPLERFKREFVKDFKNLVPDVGKLWTKLTRSLTIKDSELREFGRVE